MIMNNILNNIINLAKILLVVFFSALFLKVFFVDAYFVPSQSMENTLLPGDYVFVNKFIYGAKTPKYFPFTNKAIPQIKFPAIRDIQTGDIIVFELPGNKDEIRRPKPEYYMKRVIACPGDTFSINETGFFINSRHIAIRSDEFPDKNREENISDIFFYELGFRKYKFGPIRIPKSGDTLQLDYNNISLWKIFIEREGHKAECKGLKVYIDNVESGYHIINRDYCFVIGDNLSASIDSRYWGFLPVENIIGKVMVVYWSMDSDGIRFPRIGKVAY
jgi:signal peptidase I